MIGRALHSCGTWTAERRAPDPAVAMQYEQWILGFMAGAGEFSLNLDPLNGVDTQGVWARIDNYCAAHPLDLVATAGSAFVAAHPH